VKELVALVLVVAPGVVVYAGWRRERFELAFAGAVVALLGVWGASALAIETDYRDADGYMDCWPSCTAYHHAVGVAFWLTIPVLVLLTAASAVGVAVSALRRRAARRHG
jgi:hypothetical protein